MLVEQIIGNLDVFYGVLTQYFNEVFTSKFPSAMKLAHIIPALKRMFDERKQPSSQNAANFLKSIGKNFT